MIFSRVRFCHDGSGDHQPLGYCITSSWTLLSVLASHASQLPTRHILFFFARRRRLNFRRGSTGISSLDATIIENYYAGANMCICRLNQLAASCTKLLLQSWLELLPLCLFSKVYRVRKWSSKKNILVRP